MSNSPVLPTSTLSKSEDKWIRFIAVLMIGIVSVSAAVLSWNGLTYLGTQSGIPADIAWLLPVAIDGSIILGSAEVLHASMTSRNTGYGWLLTLIGVVLSIWGNIVSASSEGFQAAAVHAIAPVVLFLSVEAMVRITKHRITATQEAVEQAKREAERLARKAEKAEQAKVVRTQSSKPKTGTAGSGQNTASVSKRGGTKLLESDPEVSDYKSIMDTLPADASKASKIESVLREYGEARPGHLAMALGCEQKQVATTIVRIRERVLAEQSDDGQFQEIVKDLVPASADSESK